MTSETMNAIERYEALADCFYRCHRFMAPGKSQPLESYYEDTHDRFSRWNAFLLALGPSDRACVLATWLLEEAQCSL